ncbi:MAG: transcription elongation factor GreB [Polaromonas sp.]|nr:transcription elongation factor GreB [Polaromonas sp.]
MSKAFTRESDTDTDEDEAVIPPLPASAQGKNYMTRQGYERLRHELLNLIDNERPKVVEVVHWAASNGDRSENGDYLYGKKRLREIDRRIRFLTHRLEMVELVDPSVHQGSDQIYFGARVTYERQSGEQVTVTILGIDEANSANAEITWVSPVARSLLKARVGDEVVLHTPSGREVVEILSVSYDRTD